MGAGRLKGNNRKKRGKGRKKKRKVYSLLELNPEALESLVLMSLILVTYCMYNEFMNRIPSQNGKVYSIHCIYKVYLCTWGILSYKLNDAGLVSLARL